MGELRDFQVHIYLFLNGYCIIIYTCTGMLHGLYTPYTYTI